MSDELLDKTFQAMIANTVKNLLYAKSELDLPIDEQTQQDVVCVHFTKEDGERIVNSLHSLLTSLEREKLDVLLYKKRTPENLDLVIWYMSNVQEQINDNDILTNTLDL